MAKSIHDLSEEEISNLSKEIKELLKEYNHSENKKITRNNDIIYDDDELSSWFTTTEEFKEMDENLTKGQENLSQEQWKEVKKEMQKIVEEKKSLAPESSEHSETCNIEDLIKNDETLKELEKLTSILQNEDNEFASNETGLIGSSASWTTATTMKKTKKSKTDSIGSTTIAEINTLNSNTLLSDLKPKETKKNTAINNEIINRNPADLRFESTSKKDNFLKQRAERGAKNDGSELKIKKVSSGSMRSKKKHSNKEQPQQQFNDELKVKKKPYSEGSPEYKKGQYVPIVSKRKKFKEIGTKGIPALSTPPIMDPEAPLFPLKIECISMFSEDEVEEEVSEEGSEDEWISRSSSSTGEPEVMLKRLWQDVLLPTDESDLDLDEFYKQFPKLKKKTEHKEPMEESDEILFTPMF